MTWLAGSSWVGAVLLSICALTCYGMLRLFFKNRKPGETLNLRFGLLKLEVGSTSPTEQQPISSNAESQPKVLPERITEPAPAPKQVDSSSDR